MRIVFTDADTVLSDGLNLERFNEFGEVKIYGNLTHEQLGEKVKDAEAIICNKTVITDEIMQCAPKLKYIGLLATGYNNIEKSAANKREITVCNAGQYSTDSVAQQVFAYILNFASRVREYDEQVKSGKWESSDIFCIINQPTMELSGKTLGVVGYGSIGRQVACIAEAFGMNVLVYTRTKRDNYANYVSLEELLQKSDFISVHCPLTNLTEKMFNEKAFSLCKDNCYFINTSRGAVVDEQALYNALNSGKIAGAALDVLEKEPMSKDCILKDAKNILFTPHVAWAPYETRVRLLDIVYDNLKCFIEGRAKNVVI